MFSDILKLIIKKKMDKEIAKIADSIKDEAPGIEAEFKLVQKSLNNLQTNIEWFCKANPESSLCKERKSISWKKKKK